MPTAQDALAALQAKATPDWLAKLDRFGISAKELGRDHSLALALWKPGVYEARCLTAFVDEPARVTSSQMDRWCRDFDNWGICDTLCFHLFDRVPGSWEKVAQWAVRDEEFVKRAAFAL